MEVLTNVASAASKTIFGDGSDKKEPVSGRSGDVTKGEPYDAGNLDPEDQRKFEALPTPTPGTETKNPILHSPTDDPVAAATTSDEPAPKGDTSAGQTDPKPDPTDTSDRPEEATTAKDLEGPGPKPVEVLAREHGGDAGQVGKVGGSGAIAEDKKEKEDEEDDGDKGTGEKVVHASGLAADGGDFDAANAGAGREADRLMHEKGIDHGDQDNGTSSPSGSGKKSIKDRIKAKFHKS